jgi:hypothetical protein
MFYGELQNECAAVNITTTFARKILSLIANSEI